MWLSEQEQVILRYLQDIGEVGASAREICRKSWTKDAWKKNERWAYPYLTTLKEKNLITMNPAGNYIVPPTEEDEEEKRRQEGKK